MLLFESAFFITTLPIELLQVKSYLAHVAKNDHPLQRILTRCRGRGETILLAPSKISVFQLVTYLVVVSIASHKKFTPSSPRHHQKRTVLGFLLVSLVDDTGFSALISDNTKQTLREYLYDH